MDILQAALLIGLAFILFLLVMLIVYYFVYTSSHPATKPQPPMAPPPSVQYGYNASRVVVSSENDPAGAILKVSLSCLILAFTAAVILSCIVAIVGAVIAAALGVGIIEALSMIPEMIEEMLP